MRPKWFFGEPLRPKRRDPWNDPYRSFFASLGDSRE